MGAACSYSSISSKADDGGDDDDDDDAHSRPIVLLPLGTVPGNALQLE